MSRTIQQIYRHARGYENPRAYLTALIRHRPAPECVYARVVWGMVLPGVVPPKIPPRPLPLRIPPKVGETLDRRVKIKGDEITETRTKTGERARINSSWPETLGNIFPYEIRYIVSRKPLRDKWNL